VVAEKEIVSCARQCSPGTKDRVNVAEGILEIAFEQGGCLTSVNWRYTADIEKPNGKKLYSRGGFRREELP